VSHTYRLPPSVKHGLTLLGGATLAQVIPALASPLIARLFVPSAIGAFAFVVAALGVLAPIVCLRYDVAIVLPDDDRRATLLTALCFGIAAVGSVLSVAALLLISHFGPSSEMRTAAPLLLAMLPLGIILLVFQLVGQSWSMRLYRYRLQSRATMTQALVTVAAQIGLIPLFGASALTLVVGTLAGYAALVCVYLPVIRDPIALRLREYHSREGMLEVARGFARFPLYTGPYAFLGQMSVRIIVLALAAFTTARIVGQYAVAQRVIFLPVVTLMAAASQIFYSRAARRLDDPRMPHMVRTMLLAGPVVVGPFFVLVILFAEPVFELVFGHPWRQAGHFAAILALPSMVKTLTAWLDRVFDIRGRQLLPLILEAIYVGVLCVAIYLTLRLTHDADLAVMVYAAVTVLFYLVWMMCALLVAGYSARFGTQFMIVTAAVVALMLGVDAFIRWLDNSAVLRSVCAGLLATILCLAGIWFGRERMRAMEQLAH
jgi:O-antigen/teichoic acid export membrane protein